MKDLIQGKVLNEEVESEPYEYYDKKVEKEVTGWLRDAVLGRVKKTDGLVESLEVTTSWGTCDLCSGYGEGIRIRVDGEDVFVSVGERPFLELIEWLNGEG